MLPSGGTPAAWFDRHPQKFDVLWAYFPFVERPDTPAIVPHPVLVLALGKNPSGELGLLVAFGSSRGVDSAGASQAVFSPDECAFLDYETRFDLRRRLWLPYNDIWFVEARGSRSPRLGTIPEAVQSRVVRAKEVVESEQGYPIAKVQNHRQ